MTMTAISEYETPSECPHCRSSSIKYVKDRGRWVCLNCTSKFRLDGHILDWREILLEDAEAEHREHYHEESKSQFDDFLAGEALI